MTKETQAGLRLRVACKEIPLDFAEVGEGSSMAESVQVDPLHLWKYKATSPQQALYGSRSCLKGLDLMLECYTRQRAWLQLLGTQTP